MTTGTILTQGATTAPRQPSTQERLRAAFQITSGRIISVMATPWTDDRKVSFRVSVVRSDGSMTNVHRLFAETATLAINDLLWALTMTRNWQCRPLHIGAGFIVSHKCYLSYARQTWKEEGI